MPAQDNTPRPFTTIRTAEILDFIVDAVDTARTAAGDNASWQAAIDGGYDYLLTTDAIAYDLAASAVRVESATRAGRVYIANGDCQCEAFTRGKGVCWHRAAARLVRRALELRDLAEELITEAHESGDVWYGPREACIGARWRIGELAGVAEAWDRGVARQRAAA